MPVRVTTEAVDDYLKIIFALTREGGMATTGAIAERLDLTPASVTGMIQRLAGQDPPLVEYSKNRGAALTDAGRERALEVIRHHRLLETFLHETLGISWERVHEEAEKLEHYISEELEDRIAAYLGNPEVDPHGSPIPHKDGTIPRVNRMPLLDLEPGTPAVVARIPRGDPELRSYLKGLGLIPGAPVVLESVEPFGGPVYLRCEERRHGIGPEIARRLLVVPEKG
ncbi:MAG TPA: metal-dependent transcriptional regulator [bacterium]|nr:metal-dependent transcriptional regulator [bacterium]